MNNNIGKNIRAYRKTNNMTQEKLGELSGLSINFISRLERTNDQNVSLTTLNKIARAFNISTAELLTGLNKPKQINEVEELRTRLYQLSDNTAKDLSTSFINIIKHVKE